MRLVHADAIVTGDSLTLRDAAVVFDDHGTVACLGTAADILPSHVGLVIERVHGVLMPGTVNAHTHLELCALGGKVRGGQGFFRWVDDMLGARMELDELDGVAGIVAGVRALDAFGTAAVGEVTNTLAAVQALASAGIAGSVFHEVFGVDRSPAMARSAALAAEVEERFPLWPSTDLAYAPSPHTLYTTHPDAVRCLFAMSRASGARATIHLLEHAAERRAIEHGDGDAAEWLARRVSRPLGGFAWPKTRVLDYLGSVGGLDHDVLLVHLTEATSAELGRIAESGSPVVLCPRSNVTIEGRMPPLGLVQAAGIEAALGTDSLASSPSLDVLCEARELGLRFADVTARSLLQMATWNGARALGRADLGRIVRGARPGIFAVQAPLADGEDPDRHVLDHLDAPRDWIVRRATHYTGNAA